MKRYARAHLSDQALERDLIAAAARECSATAELLALIAEYDARRLFREAGYDSMFAWCVGVLHLSEVAAYKRIRAARAGRRFPEIFEAISQGRLHLTAVVLLAPHLTEHTAGELLNAATHQTRAGIERLLAGRYPKPDLPTRLDPIAIRPGMALELAPEPAMGAQGPSAELASGPVAGAGHPGVQLTSGSVAGAGTPGAQLTSGSVPSPEAERHVSIVKPLAPQRFALQCTIDQETHQACATRRSSWATRFRPATLRPCCAWRSRR